VFKIGHSWDYIFCLL